MHAPRSAPRSAPRNAQGAPCWPQHGACTSHQAVSNARIPKAVLRAM